MSANFAQDFSEGTLKPLSAYEPPPMGHNNPPEPTLEERLREAASDLIARRDTTCLPIAAKWETDRPAITDDDGAKVGAQFVKWCADWLKETDALRVQEKKPYLDAERTVDAVFKDISQPVLTASNAVRKKLDAYLAEEKRKADEAAAKLRAEQEAARKAAEQSGQSPAPQLIVETAPIQARSDGGALATARTTWDYEVVDLKAAPIECVMVNDAVVKALIKGGRRDIPGFRIFPVTKATVR